LKFDTVKPFTYAEFRTNHSNTISLNEVNKLYTQYLKDWNDNKATLNNTLSTFAQDNYKDYLKQINLNNLDYEVRDFLNSIDYTSDVELDLALDYFINNIKQNLLNVVDARDNIKLLKYKNNFKASIEGIRKYIKSLIVKLVQQINIKNSSTYNIQEISNKLEINLVRLFSNTIINYDKDTLPNVTTSLNFENAVYKESKNVKQLLHVTKNNKKSLLRLGNGKLLSVNQYFTDYKRLPDRYFYQDIKSKENCILTLNKKLLEKYIGTDVFYLSGNGEEYNLTKVFSPEHRRLNQTNLLNPSIEGNFVNYIPESEISIQLDGINSGLASYVADIDSFNIELSATKGEFVFNDPLEIEPGFGTRNVKLKSPINIFTKTDWIKLDNKNNTLVKDSKSIKGDGYQSKEASLEYSYIGINKRQDNFNFWDTPTANFWTNEDAYPIVNFSEFPEAERLDDLLITNDTIVYQNNDYYGNEFAFIKSSRPKRYNNNTYAPYSLITIQSNNTTNWSIYDGLFFNTVLSAISAARVENGEDVSNVTLTSIYDTILTNNSISADTCNVDFVDGLGFSAPLSSTACSAISLSSNDIVDGGGFYDIVDNADVTAEYFNTKPNVLFDPYAVLYTTLAEAATANNPTTNKNQLYVEKYVTAGSIYVRDVSTQKVYTLYERLSATLSHLSDTEVNDISSNNITNFAVLGDTLFFQTSSYTFTVNYKYDGNFSIKSVAKSLIQY
jgi:hypothetical protein